MLTELSCYDVKALIGAYLINFLNLTIMFSNHLFWLAIGLLTWSGFSIVASNNFKGSSNVVRNIMMWLGFVGLIAGLIRMITLSIHFNWWWFLGIGVGFFVFVGILSSLIRGNLSTLFSMLGVIGIPVIWWIGGVF